MFYSLVAISVFGNPQVSRLVPTGDGDTGTASPESIACLLPSGLVQTERSVLSGCFCGSFSSAQRLKERELLYIPWPPLGWAEEEGSLGVGL